MTLTVNELDIELLTRCVEEGPRGWEDFVDRFMGLVVHVIDHTLQMRGLHLDEAEREMFCEEVFSAICHDSFHLLRNFDGKCLLTTYMTIVVRRIVVRLLLNNQFSLARKHAA
ncbi:MAG: hypothetical protein FWC50_03815 [Planctomycetaceae bacterium]|nr:hypothetical protein [Planctomycetaceae bacterium]